MAEISCKHIGKSYGSTEVVTDFNLDVEDHEFVVFLGPSGCGKSTILRMVAGLEPITSGDLLIKGQVVNDLEPRERGIAMVFQNYALYPHMTIRDNIAFGLRRLKVPESEISSRIESVTGMLGLDQVLQRKPLELSGGQQQRVAIARAMIKTPDVFLFDEPLSNLDAKLRAQMRMEIAKLHKELRTTTIYVTHDQMEAMTLADRIVLLNAGQIEQVGTPEEIYEEPKTLFVAGFIGTPAMNFIDVVASKTSAGWRLAGPQFDLGVSQQEFQLVEGQELVLGVRPGSLELAQDGEDSHQLSGRCDLVEFHGDQVLVSFGIAGQSVEALIPEADRPREGNNVSFQIKPKKFHLFDRESGRSIKNSTDVLVVS